MLRVCRYLWALPTTSIGLLVILPAYLTGARVQCVNGVLEVHGGLIRWMLTQLVPLPGGASALTLGHVVLGRNPECLDLTRLHERVHVRQVERWGFLFIPAYLGCSVWLLIHGRDAYRENPFEREAYACDDPQSPS